VQVAVDPRVEHELRAARTQVGGDAEEEGSARLGMGTKGRLQVPLRPTHRDRTPPVKSSRMFSMLHPTVLLRRKLIHACGTILVVEM